MLFKILTATGVVTAAGVPGRLIGVLITAGAGACTALFKDGGASGTSVIQLNVPQATTEQFEFRKPIPFTTDIHLTLANGAYAYILFEQYKAE